MLYCSSECGSINYSNNLLQHACLYISCVLICLLALTFVCNSTYLLRLEVQRYDSKQHDALIIHVCLACLFLHSGQVLSSFKCYFKRKYLNLIDSNCDVNESCPWFFIGTVLATGPECIINIYVMLGRRNLFEMGAVRSASESGSVTLVWRLGILVTGAWSCAHGKQ